MTQSRILEKNNFGSVFDYIRGLRDDGRDRIRYGHDKNEEFQAERGRYDGSRKSARGRTMAGSSGTDTITRVLGGVGRKRGTGWTRDSFALGVEQARLTPGPFRTAQNSILLLHRADRAARGRGASDPHTLNAQGSRRVLYPACICGFTLLGRIGVIRLFI